MEEDFYASIKIISGEEIFAQVAVCNEDDKTYLILDNPVVIVPVLSKTNRIVGHKITPWVNVSDDEMFIIDFEKVITMTEIKNKHIISIYTKFNKKTNKVQVTKNMGLISKVDSAREHLEKIYRSN